MYNKKASYSHVSCKFAQIYSVPSMSHGGCGGGGGGGGGGCGGGCGGRNCVCCWIVLRTNEKHCLFHWLIFSDTCLLTTLARVMYTWDFQHLNLSQIYHNHVKRTQFTAKTYTEFLKVTDPSAVFWLQKHTTAAGVSDVIAKLQATRTKPISW